jgi:radical SAM protein with 4Fe4S-binding SPASM domain
MIDAEEFQVEVDDVYACPGRCPGCVLSSSERRTTNPDMSTEIRKSIFRSLSSYVKSLTGLKKMNLTYGIADHFMMSLPYLTEIYEDAKKFFADSCLENSGSVFITTSLIGKADDIRQKIDALSLMSTESVPLGLIVVFDPGKWSHKRFGDTYEGNIKYAKEKFSVVDLAINLSDEAMVGITPEEMIKFSLENGFEEVTVNWVPTDDNIKHTYSAETKNKLSKWLIDFSILSDKNNIQSSYKPVIKKAYDAWRCAMDSESDTDGTGVLDVMEKLLKNTLGKSIQFDHNGNVFAKWEAIGDVPSNARTGLSIWGNVSQGDLSEIINNGLLKTKKESFKSVSTQSCLTCKYAAACATTGFHVYSQVIRRVEKSEMDGCPHVAFGLWDYFGSKSIKG